MSCLGPVYLYSLISQFAPHVVFLFLLASHLLPPMLRNNVAGMNCRMILILALVEQLGEKTVRNLLPPILLVHSFVDPHFAVCGYRYYLWKAFSFRPVYPPTFLYITTRKRNYVQLNHHIKLKKVTYKIFINLNLLGSIFDSATTGNNWF